MGTSYQIAIEVGPPPAELEEALRGPLVESTFKQAMAAPDEIASARMHALYARWDFLALFHAAKVYALASELHERDVFRRPDMIAARDAITRSLAAPPAIDRAQYSPLVAARLEARATRTHLRSADDELARRFGGVDEDTLSAAEADYERDYYRLRVVVLLPDALEAIESSVDDRHRLDIRALAAMLRELAKDEEHSYRVVLFADQ